jgi:hypothetical protein
VIAKLEALHELLPLLGSPSPAQGFTSLLHVLFKLLFNKTLLLIFFFSK